MRSVRDYLRVSVIFLILCTLMSTAAFGGDLPAARTLKAAEKAGLTGVVRIGKKTYFLNARHQPDTAKGLHVVRQDQTYVLVQKDGLAVDRKKELLLPERRVARQGHRAGRHPDQ